MTPLPAALGGTEFLAWRLDEARFAATWESGEGAFRYGGRWNTPGVRAVYCALEPSTAILEVAVHKGFAALDRVPHTLTSLRILAPAAVHVVQPDDIPNPRWLSAGPPSVSQMEFGTELLSRHPLIILPSAVSSHSWNLVFVASRAVGMYELVEQNRFGLDTRLNPPSMP